MDLEECKEVGLHYLKKNLLLLHHHHQFHLDLHPALGKCLTRNIRHLLLKNTLMAVMQVL
jgi:hypothetical protein